MSIYPTHAFLSGNFKLAPNHEFKLLSQMTANDQLSEMDLAKYLDIKELINLA